MQIPEGAKFMFVAIPLILVASILIFIYVGKDNAKSSNLNENNFEDLTKGKSMDQLNDFEELTTETVKEGSGPSAAIGDTVVVNYEGKLKDGTVFDSSYGRSPFEFTLGENMVIKGWEQGVKGMKVGEERILNIPSNMAYGDAGVGSQIPPKSGLIFKVELLEIK